MLTLAVRGGARIGVPRDLRRVASCILDEQEDRLEDQRGAHAGR